MRYKISLNYKFLCLHGLDVSRRDFIGKVALTAGFTTLVTGNLLAKSPVPRCFTNQVAT